jgi:predicted transcriptional regulator
MEPLQRPDLYVIVRVLEAVRASERRLNRTQLQIACGLNYTQFQRYLELAVGRGLLALVNPTEGAPWVELTPKGYDALMFLVQGMREVGGSHATPSH